MLGHGMTSVAPMRSWECVRSAAHYDALRGRPRWAARRFDDRAAELAGGGHFSPRAFPGLAFPGRAFRGARVLRAVGAGWAAQAEQSRHSMAVGSTSCTRVRTRKHDRHTNS